jgi:hypothetical protein
MKYLLEIAFFLIGSVISRRLSLATFINPIELRSPLLKNYNPIETHNTQLDFFPFRRKNFHNQTDTPIRLVFLLNAKKDGFLDAAIKFQIMALANNFVYRNCMPKSKWRNGCS